MRIIMAIQRAYPRRINLVVCTILVLFTSCLAVPTRTLLQDLAATPVEPVIAGAATTTTNTATAPLPATATAPIGTQPEDPMSTEVRTQVATLSEADLTAPDGFVYDFQLTDVDYIPAETALAHGNLTTLPGVPEADVTVYRNNDRSTNPLLTWRLDMLEYNKALSDRQANRRIEDAVRTLVGQADLYMDEPLFLVTNKTGGQLPWAENDDPRVYFSLSDHYWPFQVSSVNRNGIPYSYNASVNPEVYDLTPNKRHLELTIEHISTLALAYYFTTDLRYAKRARDKAAVWFLDPGTAMFAKYAGRLAGVRRGGTRYGRPEGVYDMARLPDLLNGIIMLTSTSVWDATDTTNMLAWVRDYVGFLEGDPVAKYARMMGNYVATNVDEQLLAAYLYLGAQGNSNPDLDQALRVAHYSSIRQRDQIRDAKLHYEKSRQRSLDYSQQCIQSWVNIAIMSERLGVDVWYRGLGEGWSIKDAFDQNRGYFESLGLTWPFQQVGTPRVRVAGQLVLPIYVGYRLKTDPPQINSGPVEYIQLYNTMWASFTTSGSQARGIIERLPHIELDTFMAEDGIPLIEECDNLWCDTRTLAIWGATSICIMLVSFCLCWNCYIHWKANIATDVPIFLRNIREQQAKYKQMNLKVAPAKPDYVIVRKANEERRRMEDKLAEDEEKKDKQLKQKIKQTEEKLQRRRESKMASQMQSQMMGFQGMQPGIGQYAPSYATSQNGSSFYANDAASDVASSANGQNAGGQIPMPGGFSQPQFSQGYGANPFGHPSPDGWGAPGRGHNVQGQVIMEEGGEVSGPTPGDSGSNGFAFPGAHEQEDRPSNEGYAGMDHIHEGPVAAGNSASYQLSPPNTSGALSLKSPSVGYTNTLSTGTGPSQSLTGLLAGANDLLGEMGTSQAQTATGPLSGPRSSTLRQTTPDKGAP